MKRAERCLLPGVFVLSFVALLIAGCGDSTSGTGTTYDMNWFAPDGGRDGLGGWPDTTPPPPPPPPPPPIDAGAADVNTGPDGGGTGGPLKPAFAGPFYEHTTVPAALDVGILVTGGKGPYTCSFYLGDGRGTLPASMNLAGCTLSGTFGADDPPGVYAFIIIVADQAGQKLEVPVVVRQGSCNTTAATLTPPEYPVRVGQPGGAYEWDWQLNDVDTPCTDGGCASCSGCVRHGIGTKLPLKLATFLDCTKAGDLCFTGGDIQNPPSCPNTTPVGWNGKVQLKAHTPLRSDGGVAWVTVEADATYSGDTTGMSCGNKKWACHLEVLEQ